MKRAPAVRGGKGAGITQPRDHSLADTCRCEWINSCWINLTLTCRRSGGRSGRRGPGSWWHLWPRPRPWCSAGSTASRPKCRRLLPDIPVENYFIFSNPSLMYVMSANVHVVHVMPGKSTFGSKNRSPPVARRTKAFAPWCRYRGTCCGWNAETTALRVRVLPLSQMTHLNLDVVVLEKSSCTLNMAENKRSLCDPAELFRRWLLVGLDKYPVVATIFIRPCTAVPSSVFEVAMDCNQWVISKVKSRVGE